MKFTVKLAPFEENITPNRAFAKSYQAWCKQTFGPAFQGLPPPRKWTDMRWAVYDTHIRFKNEEDMMLFVLTWAR